MQSLLTLLHEQIFNGSTVLDRLVGTHRNMTYTSTTGRLLVTYGNNGVSDLQTFVAQAREGNYH